MATEQSYMTSTMNNAFSEFSAGKSLNKLQLKTPGEPAKIAKAAKEFESFLLANMMKEMRKNIPEDGFLPKSDGEKIFQEMQDEHYTRLMVDKGGLGLSRIMLERWQKNVTPGGKILS